MGFVISGFGSNEARSVLDEPRVRVSLPTYGRKPAAEMLTGTSFFGLAHLCIRCR